MYKTLLQIIKNYLNNKDSVLELGCGNGKLISGIATSCPNLQRIVAIDYFNEPKQLPPKVDFIKQDLENFHLSASFDLVILNQVLEHIKNPLGLLENIKKILNKNGRILIVVPNRFGFNNEAKTYIPEHGKHYFIWDKESLEYSLERIGFRCRFHYLYTANSHNLLVKYIPVLLRLQNPNLICEAMLDE